MPNAVFRFPAEGHCRLISGLNLHRACGLWFTVNENTGAVTLTDEYQKTLAPGVHTLTVIISGTETTTNFTVQAAGEQRPVSPQTGDNSHIELWIVLMTVSAVGAISLVLFDKKQRVSEK